MSQRNIKKLQEMYTKPRDSLSKPDESDESECSEEEQPLSTKINPFSLLSNDQTPSDNEAKEDDDVEQDDEAAVRAKENDASSAMDSLKRKKKKKRKKQKENKDDNEDVEVVAREVKNILGEEDEDENCQVQGASKITSSSQSRGLFTVDYRNLLAENELKKIFGSKVVQSEMHKHRGRHRSNTKAYKLVIPRSNWHPLKKLGISMNLLETKDGINYFKFEHNAYYQQIQFKFLDAVDSLDPSNITAVLNLHPYHIDALIQLSEIVRLGEEMQMAVELIERALCCFERSFHSGFNIAQGTSRVDYRYDENRAFHIVLFKHLTFVGQRGCYRTALEFCKVLFGLDPEEDPLGVLLVIDFYAVKSREFAYLLNLFDTLEVSRNLSQLPNFSFNIALASFHYYDAREMADKRLQDALIAFPGVLTPLLEKCNVQPDTVVGKHSFFNPITCQRSCPAALESLIHLYVGRCFHLWKEPEVLSWLEYNVKQVLERVDRKDPLVAFHEEKRKIRYQGMPRNIQRHILLSEVKEATTALPQDVASSSVLSFDPLPPLHKISSYTVPARNRTETDQNFLQMLLNSIFPQYTIQEADRRMQVRGMPNDENAANNQRRDRGALNERRRDADVARGAVGGTPEVASDTQAFRHSLTMVLDAMRDLLSNFQMTEIGQDADADDSDIEDVD